MRAKRARPALPQDRFDPKAYARKTACVLGLGRSGLAAARLLARKGLKVFASDERPRAELKAAAARLPRGASWEGGRHSDRVLKCAFAVKSPGIHPKAPVLERLKSAGVPVFSELEVALAFCSPRELVAVTGTNGKTTTAHLAAAVFKAARRRTHLLGNVGEAVSGAVRAIRPRDTVVLEASSYQLEDSRFLKPDAAAILNVTSDHLDHHGSMAAYLAAKARVFRAQDRRDACVFNGADPLVVGLARGCRARRLFFAHRPSTMASAWLEKGRIRLRLPGSKKVSSVAPPKLPGDHNLENAMAAALLGLARGVPPAAIERAFRSFRGVEHRLEPCGKAGLLECVNDSKATNVDSTLAALRAVGPTRATHFSYAREDRGATAPRPGREGRILLILGGKAKEGGFRALRPAIERCVKAVLAIGAAAPKIEEDLAGACHVFPCGDLETAVRTAVKIGQRGELLLLSPACASFDQFQDYEDRGRRFKEIVKKAGRKR